MCVFTATIVQMMVGVFVFFFEGGFGIAENVHKGLKAWFYCDKTDILGVV